jgi:Na+/proline symporter
MNTISSATILYVIITYFALLLIIAYLTGKKNDNESFFLAGRQSKWYLVAFAMIGASISGVTFISIPGVVGKAGVNENFSYMQLVFGYLLGYLIIANVLMPVYYKMNLTSIYEYMNKRFGYYSYKTSAFYFLISKIVGASFRFFLVSLILDKFLTGPFGIPFPVTVAISIALIWLYTFRGGTKTVIITDSVQTAAFLLAVILTIIFIGKEMNLNLGGIVDTIKKSEFSQMFYFQDGWSNPNNFFKQFFSGALIAIVMTGMDQDMMQKNLSCKNIKEAKKNMYTMSTMLVFVNILFLSLGALLYIFANTKGIEIPKNSDLLYPTIALNYLPQFVGIIFLIGITAAAYSSADSALTGLTTSFSVDFLGLNRSTKPAHILKKTRMIVHFAFSVVLFLAIIIFHSLNNDAVINGLFKAAGYTYGPILGLFTFGLTNKLVIRDNWVLPVVIIAPLLSYIIDMNSKEWLNGFTFGFFILAVNGLLTYLGLWLISINKKSV